MRNAHRDRIPTPQASMADSPAFREWQKKTAPSQRPGSGRQGSGGSGGYGLALISADPASQERIRAILRAIREREQQP